MAPRQRPSTEFDTFVLQPDREQSLFESGEEGDLLGTHAGQESWAGRLQASRMSYRDGQPSFADRQRNRNTRPNGWETACL